MRLFAEVMRFCRSCGVTDTADPCSSCGVTRQRCTTGPYGALGARVTYRTGFRRRPYLVIGAAGQGTYRLLATDGDVATAPITEVNDYSQPVTGSWTSAGALLAAGMGNDVTPAMRIALDNHALRLASDVPKRRGLLIDATRLRRDDVARSLGLTATELIWCHAAAALGRGELGTAAATLLDLPAGTYPGRLAIWFAVAEQGALTGSLRDGIRPHLDGLAAHGPAHAAAATLVVQALDGNSAPDVVGKRLLEHAREASRAGLDAAAWAQVTSDGHLAQGGTRPGRLLAARAGDRDALDGDVAILEDIAPAILDDLIDAGSIPPSWLEADHDRAEYLHARTAPERLSDEALQRYGLHEERARRAVLAGRPRPEGLDDVAAGRFELWSSTNSDDPTEAIQAVIGALSPDESQTAGDLRRLLDEPGSVPHDDVLRNPEASATLLRVWPLDTGALDPKGLSSWQRDFVAVQLLARAKDELFAWRWQAALDTAKQALRFGRAEAIRDEALSFIGCAQWELGNDDAAIQALRSALDGAYTESLQANMAVVAAELEPWTAGEHLARLVVEAPNLALRLSAARRAVEVWSHSTVPWEDESTYDLPPALAKGLRSLITEAIPLDDFRVLARLLAEHDADWLANERHLRPSPHSDTLEARIWVAKAKGMDEFIAAIAAAVGTPTAPDWLTAERDRLVGLATEVLVTEEPPLGAVSLGMAMLENQLPMDADDLAVLRAFTARAAALAIDLSEGEPSDMFVRWLEQAVQELPHIPAEVRERADGAIAVGFGSLTAAYLQARGGMLQQAAEHYDEMVDQLRSMPNYQVDWGAVRSAVQPIIDLCDDTYRLFLRLRPHLNSEVIEHVDDLLEFNNRLHEFAVQLSSH